MRYGTMLDTSRPVSEVIEEARKRATQGCSFVASSQIFAYDALTLTALVGAAVPDIEVATAVVPIYTRHPIAMAQQALTVQAATDGRLVLGIGLSHQIVVESLYGLSFAKPLRAMKEYLGVLMPLVHGESCSYHGATLNVEMGALQIEVPAPPQVIVAALGQAMLELAGEVADGTATWMTGRQTLTSHIVPTIRGAAERAGRPQPRVIASLPVAVTNDAAGATETANSVFSLYGQLPSYRAMLDREGAANPGDVGIYGSETYVREALADLEAAGVTDFTAVPIGTKDEIETTWSLLTALAVER